jgi:hypothetical protein
LLVLEKITGTGELPLLPDFNVRPLIPKMPCGIPILIGGLPAVPSVPSSAGFEIVDDAGPSGATVTGAVS